MKDETQQISNQPQRSLYRSISQRPKNGINLIKKQDNCNNNRNQKSPINNIHYIYQKKSDHKRPQNITTLKKTNKICLEGELNIYKDGQTKVNSNIKEENKNCKHILELQNNRSNYKNRITNRTRNNRGMPTKSPIPISNDYIVEKYSNNNHNLICHIVNKSQLPNHNYSVSTNFSNKSLNSNLSHNSQNTNNSTIISHKRAQSNNLPSSLSRNKNNSNNHNISYIVQSRSSNTIINRPNDMSHTYDNDNYKIKSNQCANNNDDGSNNIIKNISRNQRKYMSKTPNPQHRNRKITIKMDKDTQALNLNLNLNSTFSNNLYKNQQNRQNAGNQDNFHYNKQTLVSYNKINKSRNNNRVYNNSITCDQFTFNPNKILNYINDEQNNKINRFNNDSHNNGYNNNTINKENLDKLINDGNNNLDKKNKTYSNNFYIVNPNSTYNLHFVNNDKIINDNYNNNINNNNANNNLDNLFVYKYDISQNNINSRNNKRNANEFNNITNNKTENKTYIKNNNNDNNNKHITKEVTIRNNSSFRPNNMRLTIMNHNKGDIYNHLKMIQSKQDSNPNIVTNNILKAKEPNILDIKSKVPVIKPIRKIQQFTHVGYNGEKDKDFNQDIAFVERKFAGDNIFIFLGVCDGHGVVGHEVSDFLRNNLPKELSKSLDHKDLETKDIKLKKNIFNVIESTFIKINNMLIDDESINSYFSGTTCVSVIYTPKKLICANVGDSRAVLGRYDKHTKKWAPIELSRDHKPTEPDEAKRILNRGGRIKPFIDEVTGEEFGPQRIWVKNEEVPGLAMTRSFGDRVAASVGCISLPEIKEFDFDEGDKFLILASDGIWEFIESEECINIIGKYYNNNNIEECCKFLYAESKKRWLKEEEVIDDITLILVFFD